MEAKSFTDLITFTRSTAGGRITPAGLFEMVAANQPRFDYDPVTKLARGLLIEEARTNVLVRSSEFNNAIWAKYADGTSTTVVTPDATVSPDGGLNACKISFAAGGNNLVTQNLTVTLGARSMSVWMRGVVGGEKITIDCKNTSSAGTNGQEFVLTTTWQRYAVRLTTISTSGGFQFRKNNSTGGLYEFYAWGAQFEIGEAESSYIPTVASQVTRAADTANINTLAPWYNAVEGTLFVEAQVPNFTPTTGIASRAVNLSESATAYMSLYRSATPGNGGADIVVGGASQFTSFTAVLVPSSIARMALAFKTDNAANAVNGSVGSTDLGVILASPNTLNIGQRASSAYWNGHIRKIRFFPRRLSNAELQAQTA